MSDPLKPYLDLLMNPTVRAVGGWQCDNHGEQTDEDEYVAKAEADVAAFSEKIDQALSFL